VMKIMLIIMLLMRYYDEYNIDHDASGDDKGNDDA